MNRTLQIGVGIGVAAVVAAGGYVGWQQRQRTSAPPPAPPPVAQAPAPAEPAASVPAAPVMKYPIEAAAGAVAAPPVAGDPAKPVPVSPAESDGYMREALQALLGKPAVLSMLQTDGFVRRVVATVDNLPRAHAAPRLWPVVPTEGRFMVEQRDGATWLAARNANRYAAFMRLVDAVDARQAVALYVRTYPLFQQAYEELGYPGRPFNDRVVEAIDDLLATPELSGPVALELPEVKGPYTIERPWVAYRHVDPNYESRSAGQKILLRMGSANALRVKAKLAEVRRLLAGGVR